MVVATITRQYSVEEAKALDDATAYELVDGALRARGSGAREAWIAAAVIYETGKFAKKSGLVCVFGSSVALHIFPERRRYFRRADASVVLRSRFADGIPPWEDLHIVPDLAVEVLSPTDNANDLDEKVQDYLAAGVRLLWVIYPVTQTTIVYRPAHLPLMLGADDEVSGFDVLPGFMCKVRDFFPQ